MWRKRQPETTQAQQPLRFHMRRISICQLHDAGIPARYLVGISVVQKRIVSDGGKNEKKKKQEEMDRPCPGRTACYDSLDSGRSGARSIRGEERVIYQKGDIS